MSGNLDVLEKRVADLEERIFGDSNKEADYPKETCAGEPIVDTLAKLNSQMNVAISGRPKIQPLMKRIDQLEKLLDPSCMESLMLSQEAKAEIILTEEELIRQQAVNLERVKKMQDVLGSEHINSVPSLQGKLQDLTSIHLQQQDSTVELSEQIKEVLLQYNTAINLLSKQFVQWDQIVTRMEIAANPEEALD